MSICQNSENIQKNLSLHATNISKNYGSNCIVQNINLELKENELVGLVGKSGVRKNYCF